jgi:hypothetical protein
VNGTYRISSQLMCGELKNVDADAVWNSAEKKVELEDAIPAYNYDTDAEWDGWEAREMLLHCANATEGPGNYVVFEFASTYVTGENVFIFVSLEGLMW